MEEEKTKDEAKKAYEKPELKVHGDLREITNPAAATRPTFLWARL